MWPPPCFTVPRRFFGSNSLLSFRQTKDFPSEPKRLNSLSSTKITPFQYVYFLSVWLSANKNGFFRAPYQENQLGVEWNNKGNCFSIARFPKHCFNLFCQRLRTYFWVFLIFLIHFSSAFEKLLFFRLTTFTYHSIFSNEALDSVLDIGSV